MPSKAVLVTGCSSGIGHATAEKLAADGWTVYATARRPEAIDDLKQKGCETLALDVTDEASMEAAVDHITEAEGAVGVLVNNAGYSQSGAVETVPTGRDPPPVRDERLRPDPDAPARPARDARAAVRQDRQHRLDGRKADVSRRRIYHATKYAVEALWTRSGSRSRASAST